MTKARGRRLLFNRRRLTNLYLAPAVVVFAVLIQATLLARIRFVGASPNLLLVTVVMWSLIRGLSDGLVWGFTGGLGLDLVAGLPLGTSSLALIVTCPLAGIGKNSVFAGKPDIAFAADCTRHAAAWLDHLVCAATPGRAGGLAGEHHTHHRAGDRAERLARARGVSGAALAVRADPASPDGVVR